MRLIADSLWLCIDCTIAEVNGDYSGMEDEERAREVREALARVQERGSLAPNWDSEEGTGIRDFSWNPCDCCGSHLGGSRHRFAILAP